MGWLSKPYAKNVRQLGGRRLRSKVQEVYALVSRREDRVRTEGGGSRFQSLVAPLLYQPPPCGLHLGILYVRLALEFLVAGLASTPPTLSTADLLVEGIERLALAASGARLGHPLIVAHGAVFYGQDRDLTERLEL
jgi:hypothetical protein